MTLSRFGVVALATALLMAIGAADAQPSGLRKVVIFGDDTRRRVHRDDDLGGLQAHIGQIRCRGARWWQRLESSAVEVEAPGLAEGYRLVLTVAHAVMDGRTGGPWSGCVYYPQGRRWGALPILDQRVGPFKETYATNEHDWAALLIGGISKDARSGLPTITDTALDVPRSGLSAELFGFAHDRTGLQRSGLCTIFRPRPQALLAGQNMLITNCAGVPGTSGGPVFLIREGAPQRLIGLYRGPVFHPHRHTLRPPDRVEDFHFRYTANAVVPLGASLIDALDELISSASKR